ncbi:TPA: GTPase domain-containing protein [Vibrio parahaemolyticus]|nr:GTPase domain-containing protein [Vibrio parahaemolyticus]HCG7284487.1 GTPase domain-containing protein [Vibrio parahaemolyticus]
MSQVNLIVLGKTGVGKSTFCNYIFGKDVFKKGEGAPVTGWSDHFSSYKVPYDKFNLNVFDTVGIEVDNFDKWTKELNKFIDKRNGYDSNPNEWVHGAFYIINAASARIEPSEEKIIKKFVTSNIPLQIVLTKSDLAQESQIEALIKQIKISFGNKVNVSNVCSVQMRTRKGVKEPFGKRETLDYVLNSIDSTLKKKVGLYFIDKYRDLVMDLKYGMRRKVEDSDIGFTSLVKSIISDGGSFDFEDAFDFDLDELDELPKEYSEFLDNVSDFLDEMGFSSAESLKSYLDGIHEKVEETIELSGNKVESKLESITDKFDDDGMMNKFSAAFSIVKIIFDLKSFIKSIISEVLDPVDHYLFAEKIKLEEESNG